MLSNIEKKKNLRRRAQSLTDSTLSLSPPPRRRNTHPDNTRSIPFHSIHGFLAGDNPTRITALPCPALPARPGGHRAQISSTGREPTSPRHATPRHEKPHPENGAPVTSKLTVRGI